MADDKKKNPWWDYVQDKDEDAEEGEASEGGEDVEEKEEEFISNTPPTMQAPKPGDGTEPTLVGGFSPTPPTMQMPGFQPGGAGDFQTGGSAPMETVAPTQQYAAPTQQGFPTTQGFTPTQAGPGGFPTDATPPTMAGFPTQNLPVMPGTMPGAIPGTMPGTTPEGQPMTAEEVAQYQQLQLTDLPAGTPFTGQGGNLGLLLDVPVPLTVVLGRAVLRIQDVLGLQNGSVISLDHNSEEPVDLFIKDKLIAQGEVVVVDGNFAIKITKIVEPEQRMSSI